MQHRNAREAAHEFRQFFAAQWLLARLDLVERSETIDACPK